MNNFLHTFFSPILYFDLFGGFGYIIVALMIILILSTSQLKGKSFVISVSIQIIGITSIFVYSGLPIDKNDEKYLREQMSFLALETVEDPELKQDKQKVLNGFVQIIDKGYINRLEEADTYKRLVEFNRKRTAQREAEFIEIAEQISKIQSVLED